MPNRRLVCICGKTVRSDHLEKHQQRCSALLITNLNTKIEEQRREIEKQRLEIQELKNAHKVIFIPFRSTNLPASKKVKVLLNSLTIENTPHSIPEYIKLKHFNDKKTHNIRIKNEDSIEIIDNSQTWIEKDRTEMIDDLTDKALTELIEEFDAETYDIFNTWYKRERLSEKGYDKTPAFKEMLQLMERLLIEHS